MKIGSLEINLRHLGIFVVIVVVLVVVMNFNARLEELSQLQGKAVTVRAQATAVINTQEALQTQVAMATSPAAVEEFARSEAHMAQDGDKVFAIMPEPGSTPEAAAPPAPKFINLTKWDIWMAFIFGQ